MRETTTTTLGSILVRLATRGFFRLILSLSVATSADVVDAQNVSVDTIAVDSDGNCNINVGVNYGRLPSKVICADEELTRSIALLQRMSSENTWSENTVDTIIAHPELGDQHFRLVFFLPSTWISNWDDANASFEAFPRPGTLHSDFGISISAYYGLGYALPRIHDEAFQPRYAGEYSRFDLRERGLVEAYYALHEVRGSAAIHEQYYDEDTISRYFESRLAQALDRGVPTFLTEIVAYEDGSEIDRSFPAMTYIDIEDESGTISLTLKASLELSLSLAVHESVVGEFSYSMYEMQENQMIVEVRCSGSDEPEGETYQVCRRILSQTTISTYEADFDDDY